MNCAFCNRPKGLGWHAQIRLTSDYACHCGRAAPTYVPGKKGQTFAHCGETNSNQSVSNFDFTIGRVSFALEANFLFPHVCLACVDRQTGMITYSATFDIITSKV
jgi:hypothetical protein